MTYLTLKWLHIVSSTILFGTGLGIAFFQWFVYQQRSVAAVAAVTRLVVLADFVFTAPAVVVQIVTGVLLVQISSLAMTESWLVATWMLFAVVGACWLPVVAIQMRLRRIAEGAANDTTQLPAEFHRLMRIWFWLGWPAFAAIIVIFWLMVTKP